MEQMEADLARREADLRERKSEVAVAEFWHLNRMVRISVATVFISAIAIAGTSDVIRGDMPFEQSIEKLAEVGR